MAKKKKDVIKFNVNISAINVIIEKEEDIYAAHCLEFDIVAEGKTKKESIENILISIKNHIDFCLEMGNIDKIVNPAPKIYWNKLKYYKRMDKFKTLKYPKSIPFKETKIPFPTDIIFEDSEVYAYA